MEHQLTFAGSKFSSKRRQTRKEIFLSRMDALLPGSMLLELIWRTEHPELISGENSAEALLVKIQAAKTALDGKKKKGKAA
jgi:hypothetical protein